MSSLILNPLFAPKQPPLQLHNDEHDINNGLVVNHAKVCHTIHRCNNSDCEYPRTAQQQVYANCRCNLPLGLLACADIRHPS